MVHSFFGWVGGALRRKAAIASFCAPSLLALMVAMGIPTMGYAQQMNGITPDRLMQLQQQYGQNQNQNQNGNGSSQSSANLLQPTILQPEATDSRNTLPPSRLEQIMSARAGANLQQFGYDQLGRGASVTVPQTGAVQDDYVLGPGDEIIVMLRGQENSEFHATVDRNGQVVLPRLAPIAASGRSFGSFRDDVESAVHRSYVGTNASVSIGKVRQISVLVSGEVNNPGQRVLTGLSSALDALLLSGGVKKSGSLRGVRIQRGGHDYVVDLYSVLTDRGAASSLRLADGDRVLVPPLGHTIAVTGLVRKPGIYELAPGQAGMSVRQLLALAGGQEVRGRYRLALMHILPDGRTDLASLTGESGLVRDSEILFVQLGADQASSQATLSGGTGLAGGYALTPGSRLSDVLKAPGALGPAPYTLFGIISRKDSRTYFRGLTAFTPVAVLNGGEDQALQAEDVIRILSVREVRLISSTVRAYQQWESQVQELLRNPLGSPLTFVGGGETSRTNVDNATTGNSGDTNTGNTNTNTNTGNTNTAGNADGGLGNVASSSVVGEAIRVPAGEQGQAKATAAKQEQPQAVSGQQASDQETEIEIVGSKTQAQLDSATAPTASDRPLNFQVQSPGPGEVATNVQAATFNVLAQQLGIAPLVLLNFVIDHQVTLDGAVHGPGTYFVGPGASLQDLVAAAGGTSNWTDESGVELISTAVDRRTGNAETRSTRLPLHEGLLASYIVQPHDEFRFNQIFTNANIGSVTVQGEVRFTGRYPITRGEHLSEVLSAAGGLTNTAFAYGTVFLRRSAAEQEHLNNLRIANDIEEEYIRALTRNRITNDVGTPLQKFADDLRKQKSVGRISITADPSVLASKPELDVLLEPGDVVFIPQRPSTVSVFGQVMQPGSYPYRAGSKIGDYIETAGGFKQTADESETYLVLPDGTAHRIEHAWFTFDAALLPPGSTIFVPQDITPFDLRQTILDVTGVFSQIAITAASLAIISRN